MCVPEISNRSPTFKEYTRGFDAALLAGTSAAKQQTAAANATWLPRRYLRDIDVVLLVEDGVPQVLCRREAVGRLDERDERAALVQPELELPVELLARLERRRHTRPRREALDGRVRAFRPADAQADDVTRGEREVVGSVGEVWFPQIEPERDLSSAIASEPGPDVRSRQRHMEAGCL